MRKLLATATALTVGLVLTSGLRADDNEKGNKDSQSNNTQTQTIHGIVAGVTVEGETAVDYQSNKAVMLEAAYLTVVGTPGHGHQGGDAGRNRGNQDQQNAANNNSNGSGNNNRDSANRGGRHNVYLVWLSPKTKVCEATNANNAGGNNNSGAGNKKECSLDKLEVGDRVEIQMTSRSESSSNNQGTPTEEMRKKHGRNRIYVGDATEITILAAPRESGSSRGQGNNDDANKGNSDQNSSDKNNTDKNNSDKKSSDKNDK